MTDTKRRKISPPDATIAVSDKDNFSSTSKSKRYFNAIDKAHDATDDNAVESALKDAQLKVLNGRKFEDKLSVKVKK